MAVESPFPIVAVEAIEERTKSAYPVPHDAETAGRTKRAIAAALGPSQFGVNITRLAPGAKSALLHWHSQEDEMVLVLEGEVTLDGERERRPLRAGEAAGFPAGHAAGHRIVNTGAAEATILEIGSRVEGDAVTYSGVALRALKQAGAYRFLSEDDAEK